jgi:hypothetical protein
MRIRHTGHWARTTRPTSDSANSGFEAVNDDLYRQVPALAQIVSVGRAPADPVR